MNMYAEINKLVREKSYEAWKDGVDDLLNDIHYELRLKGLINLETWNRIEKLAAILKEEDK